MAYLRNEAVAAVITADIVNSTGLSVITEQKLLSELQLLLQPYTTEFYRGDSFQVYIAAPAEALRIALLCRSITISIAQEETVETDVRISIGLGTVGPLRGGLALAKGEAFLLSGRALDGLEKERARLVISAQSGAVQIGLQVVADYADSIFNGLTPKQAEVIAELLKGHTQQKTTELLGKSKSTISQMVHAGGWPQIERLLAYYESLVNLLL